MQLLQGYLLQELSGSSLAAKVLTSFKESIHDAAMRIVRSLVLTKPQFADKLASSSLNSTYADMCKELPVDLLRPCLVKLMEVLFEVLSSYHAMMRWHQAAVLQQQETAAEAAGLQQPHHAHASSADRHDVPSDQHEVGQMQAACRNLIQVVSEVLSRSRSDVFDVAASKVKDLLNVPNICKGEDFCQVRVRQWRLCLACFGWQSMLMLNCIDGPSHCHL